MRTLSTEMERLTGDRTLTIVPFIEITLRDGTFLRVSDQSFIYLGDDFTDFLIQPSPFVQTMNHLPAAGSVGQLYREYAFSLRNGVWDSATGQRMAEFMMDGGLLFAKIIVGEIGVIAATNPLEAHLSEREKIRELPDSSTREIFFRGEVTNVGPTTDDTIICNCTSVVPRGGLDTGYITNANSDQDGLFDGTGQRHSVIYGNVKKVPAFAVKVGALDALAEGLALDATQLTLSTGIGFPENGGTIFVGGERMTYSTTNGPTLFGLIRDDFLTAEHYAGDTVAFVPSELIFSAAAQASSVVNVYVRNPMNNALLRVSTPYTSVLKDGAAIVGQTFTSLRFTQGQWIALIESWVANARQTAQASYAPGTVPVITSQDVNENLPASGASGNQQDKQRATDGNWNGGDNIWNWAAVETQGPKELAFAAQNIAVPVPGRQIQRYRMLIQVEVTAIHEDVFDASIVFTYTNATLGRDKSNSTWTQAGVIDPLLGQQLYFGDWIDTDPNVVTAGDFASGVYDFGVSSVSSANPDLLSLFYEVTFSVVGIEYDYLDPTSLLELITPAAIQAQSGGVGVEIYTDVQGPIVPDAFGAGYPFEDGPTWFLGGIVNGLSDNSHTAYVDNTTSQMVQTINPSVIELTLANDVQNWGLVSGSGSGSRKDDFKGGRDCFGQGPFGDSGAAPGYGSWRSTESSPLDWSAGTTGGLDVYVESGNVNDFDTISFRIYTGTGPSPTPPANFIEWRETVSNLTPDEWNILEFDLTGAPPGSNDPRHIQTVGTIDLTDIQRIEVYADTNSGAASFNYAYWSNVRSQFDQIDQVSIAKNSGVTAADMVATNNVYRVTARVKGVVDYDQAEIWFSNDVVPTNPYMRLLWNPQLMGDDQITTFDVIGIETGGVPNLNAITNVVVLMNTGLTPVPGASGEGELEVYDVKPSLGVAPGYLAGIGEVLIKPTDVARHFLTEQSDIGPDAGIDETTFAQAGADLADQEVSANFSEIGEDDTQALQVLGFNHRMQILQRDTNSLTEYQALAAKPTYDWPTPTKIITQWLSIRESSVNGFNIVNRRIFLYDVDRSKSGTGAYDRALISNKDENELSPNVPTLDLENSEAAIGARAAFTVLFDTIANNLVAAQDSSSYYTLEELRFARVFRIAGVPWVDAYALERGDMIQFTLEWATVVTNARIITITKNSNTQLVEIDCVEVPTS